MNYKEIFIEKAKKVHGDKYDYSKVEYINNHTKVCIICPEHGEFWQTPQSHLYNKGCKKCSFKKMGINKTKNTEWFIKKAKLVHGDKYDYSKVEYNGNRKKICIICPEHGEFWQIAANHLKGAGCPKCNRVKLSLIKTKTIDEFIKQAKKVHGYKYDYSKVEYNGCEEKVCIICPEHGEFWQRPSVHLNGCNCPKCSNENFPIKYTTNEFIEKVKKIHGDKYDYSKTEYFGSNKEIKIVCPKHGEFKQKASSHLSGAGCPKCADNQKITTEEFIKRAKNIHGEKYDYSKVNYKWNREKIEIICHKKDKNGIEHGSFFTTPHTHLQGSGCPKCKQNYKLENEVRKLLIDNKINFEDKPPLEGLKYKHALKPDFYIP